MEGGISAERNHTVYKVEHSESGEIIGTVENPAGHKTLTETQAAEDLFVKRRWNREFKLQNDWVGVKTTSGILKDVKTLLRDIQETKKSEGIPFDMPEVI